MSKLIGAVSELNKFLRTILVCVVVGGASYCGGWLYNNLYPQAALKHKDERIQEISDTLQATQQELAQSNEKVLTLTQSLAAAHEQVERLDASIRLLKVDSRVAEITVLKQVANPQSGRAMTEFSFQEVDQDGSALDAPRRFVIDGEVVYVDYWVVKFRDQHVEEGTEGLSTSICLFRRIFGEHQEPDLGYTLDQEGSRPSAYGQDKMSDFERSLWEDFWLISNDPGRAEKLGIRAMHGEAVSARLIEGKRYRIQLRASDGLTIVPIPEPPANQT